MATRNARGEVLIDQRGPLHDDAGRLTTPGYATSLILDYNRDRIKASKWRIKEWDYYLVGDNRFAIALTLSDLGYIGLISASMIDYTNANFVTTSALAVMPMGKFRMPWSSEEGVSEYSSKRVNMRFEAKDGVRTLSCRFAEFDADDVLEFNVVLDQAPQDSMVIATPWAEDPQAFYYNQKIVGMRATGGFVKGGLEYQFEEGEAFGLLDWGRGVWTHDNMWYWSAAQGMQNGHVFGMNLGYGFGDTSAASENMIFVDGVAHKLGRVEFGIPSKKPGSKAKKIDDMFYLMAPWHMTDDEGRLDLRFTPIVDRKDGMDYKLVSTDQHQVFGQFDGHVVLDDGTEFAIRGLRGFAEAVHNVY